MKNDIFFCLTVFAPLIGASVIPFAGWLSLKFRNILSLLLVCISLVSVSVLIPVVLSGKVITISRQLPLGFNFVLTADTLAVFMAIVSTLISAIIILYSFGYISHYPNQNEYYFMVVLFLGSMMGLIFSGNLILLYVFWELTAFTSWRLIGFYREEKYVLRADKSFLVTAFGALMMMIGFIIIYHQTNSFDLSSIKEVLKTNPISNIAVILILCGILSKSATLPFHTWLPDAGVAPSPVTALLHAAILVKIGVYVFARLFIVTFTYNQIWHTIIPVLAAASALVSAGAALVDTDMKRIIAHSTVSQIAFIFLGFSIGNEIGIAGALLYILMHGISKGGLFLCAGIVEQNTKTKDITQLGGLINTMPVTAFSFLFCAFSVMGIPPFGGFFSKCMVISGTIYKGQWAIALVFLAGAFLTIMYLFRLFNSVFMGEAGAHSEREGSRIMIVCVALLALLSLISGIFIRYPSLFTQITVQKMLGG